MEHDELVEQLAARCGLSAEDAETFGSALVDVMTEELKNDYGKVLLPGLGTFKTEKREAMESVHPQVGKISISERRMVKFIPSKDLKKIVNGEEPDHDPGLSWIGKLFKRKKE
jgi:nucleoid DNA-binding protein